MTTSAHRYHVQSATMNPSDLTTEAFAAAQRIWLCMGCGAPKPGSTEINVQLDTKPDASSPLNFVAATSVPIARKDFLLSLGEGEIDRDLYLGQVTGPRGQIFHDWVTFRGKWRVIVRGSENVSHRVCNGCGRDVYFAMGKRYLYPEPPQDAAMVESNLFGLILTKAGLCKLEVGSWPGLTVDELPILDRPLDALNALRA